MNSKTIGTVSGRMRGWSAFCYVYFCVHGKRRSGTMKEFISKKCEKKLLELDLQLFSEGDGGDGSEGNGEGSEPITFTNQSDFDSVVDKRINKALETARNKWDQEQQKKLKDAENKGKMSAEEQAQYELQQEREQLEADRLSLKHDKDEAATIKRLASDKLPDSLASAMTPLYGGDEEALETAYQAISKSFREAVETAVNERLAISADAPAGNNSGSSVESTGSKAAKQANARSGSKSNLWGK